MDKLETKSNFYESEVCLFKLIINALLGTFHAKLIIRIHSDLGYNYIYTVSRTMESCYHYDA